jgi:hypothetical protein
MKIQMPQRQRMFGFKAAHLVAVQSLCRVFGIGCLPFWRATPVIALGLHVAADRTIRRQRSQGLIFGDLNHQVVVMPWHRPAGMGLILGLDNWHQPRRESTRAPDVAAFSSTSYRHRVLSLSGGIVPTLQGRKTKPYGMTCDGVCPAFFRQPL